MILLPFYNICNFRHFDFFTDNLAFLANVHHSLYAAEVAFNEAHHVQVAINAYINDYFIFF